MRDAVDITKAEVDNGGSNIRGKKWNVVGLIRDGAVHRPCLRICGCNPATFTTLGQLPVEGIDITDHRDLYCRT